MASSHSESLAALQADLEERYRFERELGRGGMAVVYLARDLKHDRDVAIKVLLPGYAEAVGAERFLAEIRTTASLNHPHILPLFDSGRAGDRLYLVMPVVEGESLRQRLDRVGRLPIDEAVRIASEVSSALDFAHRRGVIHRDIKPDNVMLHEGGALVADFGIALVADASTSRLTEAGMAIGTPSYMSPEQALGDQAVDARSDIYAVGAMLYEMLTGEPPFTSGTPQGVLAKVLTEDPVAPSCHRREIPAAIDVVVLTTLAKDPARRIASASALHAALQGGDLRVGARRPRWRPVLLAGLVVVGLLVVRLLTRGTPPPATSSIAVLPFVNQTRDTAYDYLSDGVSEDLVDQLSNLHAIQVREWSTSKRFRDPDQDLRTVAKALNGVDQIVTGRLEQVGSTIRVAAQLHDIGNGRQIWAHTYEQGYTSDISRLMADIADSIATKLQLQLAATTGADSRVTRDSLAHDLVLRGRYLVETRGPGQLRRAIGLFSEAILRDSGYAAAWAGRANARNLMVAFGGSDPLADFPAAKVDVQRALSLNPTLAEAHATLGFIEVFLDHDWPAAANEFNRALALDDQQSTTWLYRAWYYVGSGHLDSARASLRHARSLDPRSPVLALRLGTTLLLSDSLDAAEDSYREALRLEPGNPGAIGEFALTSALQGRCAAADSVLTGVQPGSNTLLIGWMRSVDARCGRPEVARAYLQDLDTRVGRGEFVDGFLPAAVAAGLHDEDATRRWLTLGVDSHVLLLFGLRYHPVFAAYRARPWFRDLLHRVNEE